MAAFRRGWSAILNAFYVGSNSTTELPQIDGLRALAVIFIMIDHAWGVAGGPNLRWTIPFTGQTVLVSGWVNRGDLGVPLFFILSGFLLPQSWLRAIHTGAPRPSLRNYFKRRLFRIVPAYYVCLFLLLVLFTPSLIPFDRVYSNDGLKELLAHLTFTHFLFTDTMGSWNIDSPMWTLTHEATFYLLLPLVFVLFIGRRSLVSVPAALVISVAWVYLSHLRMTALVDFVHQHSSDKLFFSATTIRTGFLAPQFPAYLFTFALGIALADWFVRTQLGLARRPGALAALALLAAGIVLLFASVKYIDFAQGEVASYFLVVRNPGEIAGLGLIVAGVVFGAPVARQVLSTVPMRIVGIASYSLFLWHLPMLLLVNTYPSLNKHSGSERMLQLLLYAAPLALIISLASYLLVEKPFLVAGRSRRVPAEPAPVPAPEPLQPAPADEPALEPQPVLPATPLPALGGLALSESDGSGS